MTPDAATKDRAIGALCGLAVGDALGTTLEFQPRDSQPAVTDIVGGGPFRLQPGQWTDDTSMALALADSLLATTDFDAEDLQRRFLAWVEHGQYSSTGTCFDIGQTTLAAIGRYRRTGEVYAGDANRWSAGNGSIMRLAPVAIRWWNDPAIAEQVARQQSLTTHAATECLDGCALLVRSLIQAIRGTPKAGVLAPRVDPDWAPKITSISGAELANKARSDIRSTGYVVDTLEASYWAVQTTSSFEDAVVKAVNLGDDADTVGAVTGQIAGGLYGATAIPEAWRSRVWWYEDIAARGEKLFAASHDALQR